MKTLLTALAASLCLWASAQKKTPQSTEIWEPVPPVVLPGDGTAPPSDAIVLFDGSSLDQWQTYDIIFTAPRFGESGRVILPAYVTVIHNGVLVQNHVAIWGNTDFIGAHSYKPHDAKLPISLQDHGNPVSYRNIWVREL